MAVSERRIWDTVIGHEATIKNLTELVSKNRLPHSLLFVGGPGQGKKTVAFGLAQALLCEREGLGCGECASCRRVQGRQSEGVLLLQPEKGQIKIEAARAVVTQLALSSWNKARVVIVDDAHLLNPQAANALLKSIEEPPPNTYFVLTSPSQESVLKTLRSRSQIIRFRSLTRQDMAQLDRDAFDPETVSAAFQLWSELFCGEDLRILDMTRETIDGREKALQVLQLWFEFTRDMWVLKREAAAPFHSNLATELKSLPLDQDASFAWLSKRLPEVERDIVGNCDIQLTLENFCREARGVL